MMSRKSNRPSPGGHGLKRPDRSLTKDELAATAVACFENAENLLSDARLLSESGRHARVATLTCTAIEELAKAQVCEGLYSDRINSRKYKDPGKFWTFWRNLLELCSSR